MYLSSRRSYANPLVPGRRWEGGPFRSWVYSRKYSTHIERDIHIHERVYGDKHITFFIHKAKYVSLARLV